MADLLDADKKVLLGTSDKDAQDGALRGATDAASVGGDGDRSGAVMTAATGIGIVAFIMGLANYTSHGTPYNPTLVAGCAVVVLAAAATVAWFKYDRRG